MMRIMSLALLGAVKADLIRPGQHNVRPSPVISQQPVIDAGAHWQQMLSTTPVSGVERSQAA